MWIIKKEFFFVYFLPFQDALALTFRRLFFPEFFFIIFGFNIWFLFFWEGKSGKKWGKSEERLAPG